ncbi:uncharacterized protein LOC127287917 [Leptopilina boulardi]|uniref:uncharacterized protein LOC127287917 n=1 Tax=Leptopilina boulardi TaxID=63433 RepID=UPI0021F5F5E7|nr:uncharacterized protein LOC127287917 [Leptopilina boulardi]
MSNNEKNSIEEFFDGMENPDKEKTDKDNLTKDESKKEKSPESISKVHLEPKILLKVPSDHVSRVSSKVTDDDQSKIDSARKPSSKVELKVSTQFTRLKIMENTFADLQRGLFVDNADFLELRIQILEKNYEEFCEIHDELITSSSAKFLKHPYVQEDVFGQFVEAYTKARDAMLYHVCKLRKSEPPALTHSPSSSEVRSSGKLPKIPLPTFSGDYSAWNSYKDLFSSLVTNDPKISTVEKMQYLKVSLTGEAAQLISNLSVSNDSFESAWNIVVSRYDNKRLLITRHMEQLFSTTIIPPKSAQGLNTLLSSTTEALNALSTLGLPVDQWDQVLVHHISKRLDTHTREGWEIKLGSRLDPPTYTQLKDFLTGRARALESISSYSQPTKNQASTSGKSQGNSSSQRAFAGSTQSPSQQGSSSSCSMCGKSHFVVRCEKFRDLKPTERRQFVIKERLCFNCLGPHSASACRSEKRCQECEGKHHTMIHQSTAPKINKDTNQPSKDKDQDQGTSTSNSSKVN